VKKKVSFKGIEGGFRMQIFQEILKFPQNFPILKSIGFMHSCTTSWT